MSTVPTVDRASQLTEKCVSRPELRHSGIGSDDQSLVPGEGARIGKIGFKDWLHQSQQLQPAK
jgi:hypothetical protein